MKTANFILFSANSVNFDEVRKDARKLAHMYLNAEMEEDPSSQEAKLIEAEAFSCLLEEKYGKADDGTLEKLGEIMDEEADKVSVEFFQQDMMNDDPDDE